MPYGSLLLSLLLSLLILLLLSRCIPPFIARCSRLSSGIRGRPASPGAFTLQSRRQLFWVVVPVCTALAGGPVSTQSVSAQAVLAQAVLAQSISTQDDTGKTVTLGQPARRVISLAPHATELLFAVGAQASVIGASDFSDYPPAARALPRVGGAQGLDLERITLLHPDLVVAWTSGNSPRELDTLERLGIPVFRSDPHTFEAVASNLERLGRLTGHPADAAMAAQRFRDRIEALRRRYAGRPAVSVFYQVWNKPLMTVGGQHLISQVIELCGGHNIFESLNALAPTVDAEAVLKRNPEVIAVASDQGRGQEELESWHAWPELAAVRDRHLIVLDPALITRPTPRIADGAAALCTALDAVRAARERAD